jgi:hypothetical protein
MSIYNRSASTTSAAQREPPNWFELNELIPMQALSDIRYFAKNFAGMKDLHFKETFDAKVISMHYTRNGECIKPVITGYIPAPSVSNSDFIIQKVIGHEGYWLKYTTEICRVHFIWYEPRLNAFLFWAPNKYSIVRAMNAIRKRIIKHCASLSTTSSDEMCTFTMPPPPPPPMLLDISENDNNNDDKMYADMPDLIASNDEDLSS